ncbi:hypothetical protein MMF93_01115 [Streptomyces tubbatahanensis]|uniref:Uncharacterized protein n=1 Tax=Streptomyces tubbatahanensis TaxID=2923272 RepID=A0ABY3XLC2_9ACTN|nr:hypothetical protein [Streptomyces tubbatahanensis]UNS95212.1 hypothetical protein MMF93_01115 [Streptomyces tubbatahanensis]
MCARRRGAAFSGWARVALELATADLDQGRRLIESTLDLIAGACLMRRRRYPSDTTDAE